MIEVAAPIQLNSKSYSVRGELKRVSSSTKWHNVINGNISTPMSLRGLVIDGNAEGQDGATASTPGYKQHGMLLQGVGPWLIEDIEVLHNLHAGLYLYNNFVGTLRNVCGYDNGYGDIVFTGHSQVAHVEDCSVEHINHEIDAVGGAGMWTLTNTNSNHLGVLCKNVGDNLCASHCTFQHSILEVNPGSAYFSNCEMGQCQVYFPRSLVFVNCTFDTLQVLFQTKFKHPSEFQILRFINCQCQSGVSLVGSGMVIVEESSGLVLNVSAASGGMQGMTLIVNGETSLVNSGQVVVE